MKYLLVFLGGFIVALYLKQNCSGNSAYDLKTDTVYVASKDSSDWYTPNITVFEPGRIPVSAPQPKKIIQVDSFISYEYIALTVDTLAILKDYYARLFYSDTTKTEYGKVIVNDSVTMNRITARKVFTDFKIPVVTNTITLKEKNKKFGIGLQAGYGFSTSLKPSPYIGIGIHYSLIKF